MEAPEKKRVQMPKIQWKDYFNALVELDNLPYLEKITQSFDIVVLAADSFKNRAVTEGIVIGMTVQVDGFRDQILESPRIFLKTIVVLSRFLMHKQITEVGMKIIEKLIISLSNIFHFILNEASDENSLAVFKVDFEKIVAPVFRNTLAIVTNLAGHLKMTIVQILDQLQDSKSQLEWEPEFEEFLRQTTADASVKVDAYVRFSALKGAYRRDSYQLFSLFQAFPLELYEKVVNLLSAAEVKKLPVNFLIDLLTKPVTEAYLCWKDELSQSILNKSVELCYCLLVRDSDEIVLREAVSDFILPTIRIQNSSLTVQIGLSNAFPQNNDFCAETEEFEAEERGRLEKVSSLLLDVLLLAMDARHDLRAVYHELLPMIFRFAQRVVAMNKEHFAKSGKLIDDSIFHYKHLQLLMKSLAYLKFVVIRDDPIESLRVTLDSIIELISIGEAQDNSIKVFFDINVLESLFDLLGLLMRRRCEPNSIKRLLIVDVRSSLDIVARWSTDYDLMCTFFQQYLRVGCQAILSGVNQYKFFVFCFLPFFEQLNNITITQFEPPANEEKQAKEKEEKQSKKSRKKSVDGDNRTPLSASEPIILPSDKDMLTNKLLVAQAMLDLISDNVKMGNSIQSLLSEVIPLILELYAASGSSIVPMMFYCTNKFLVNQDYAYLFETKYALDNSKMFEKSEIIQIATLLRMLLEAGNRNYLRSFTKVCRRSMSEPKYSVLRSYLFATQGNLNLRQIDQLSSMLNMVEEIFSKEKKKLEGQNRDMEEKKKKGEITSFEPLDTNPDVTTIGKITLFIVKKLEACLLKNDYTDKNNSTIKDILCRVILYRNLFPSELEKNKDLPYEELIDLFMNKFPLEIVEDQETMAQLNELSTRIENIQWKYKHVTDKTIEALNEFFKPGSLSNSEAERKALLVQRQEHLQNFVWTQSKNVEIRERLIELGYSEEIFQSNLMCSVQIDEKENILEKYKLSMSKLFGGYLELYKEIHPDVTEISIDGIPVKIVSFFEDNWKQCLSFEELRSRRSVLTREIDKFLKDKDRVLSNRKLFINRKLSLLENEEKLDAEFEAEKQKQNLSTVQKKKHFWIKINTKFLRTSSSCGGQIAGCYAPNGAHCEKSIENAFKANAAFIALYEEDKERKRFPSDKEIENVEVLFTDQGLYVYKLYTNGHQIDTSFIWLLMFQKMVVNNLVPAIILPTQFPNSRIFTLVESFVEPQYFGSPLTFQDDFFTDAGNVESYYDCKAEKIKIGDIVIDAENAKNIEIPEDIITNNLMSSSRNKKTIAPITSVARTRQKDLGGTILANVMTALTMDTEFLWKDTLKAFGKGMSQYILTLLTTANRDFSILDESFVLNAWNKKMKDARITTEQKEKLVLEIMKTIDLEIQRNYLEKEKLEKLFFACREQFFEVKSFLSCVKHAQSQPNQPEPSKLTATRLVCAMNDILKQHQLQLNFAHFDRRSQQILMKWIFSNEDKVWRDRGGRPGEETLTSFMNFILPEEKEPAPSDPMSATTAGDLPDAIATPPTGADPLQAPREAPLPLPQAVPTASKPNHYGHAPFGGFVVLSSNQTELREDGKLKLATHVPDIVAYAIGDYVAEDKYEIVTAWTHPNYRGLQTAIKLYIDILNAIEKEGVKFLICDILEGTWDRIVGSNTVTRALSFFSKKFNHFSSLVPTIEPSYESDIRDGGTERFIRIVISVPTSSHLLKLTSSLVGIHWVLYWLFVVLLLFVFS